MKNLFTEFINEEFLTTAVGLNTVFARTFAVLTHNTSFNFYDVPVYNYSLNVAFFVELLPPHSQL